MKHASKLTKNEIDFVAKHLGKLTNEKMLLHINANRNKNDQLTLQMFRHRKSKKKLMHCEMLRWEPEWVDYLKANFRTIGNVEMCGEMKTLFGLTINKKQIGKKLQLLGLKRTEAELLGIFERNKKRGVLAVANTKMWEARGKSAEGERRITFLNGVLTERIKVKGKFTPAARHIYQTEVGTIPDGHKVYHHNCNRLDNTPANLYTAAAKGLTSEQQVLYAKHDRQNKYEFEQRNLPVKAKLEIAKPVNKEISIPVILDSKTTFFVKPGTNIEAFKLRMQAHMA